MTPQARDVLAKVEFEEYERVTKDIFSEIKKVWGPYWKDRRDMAKLLVTISSGILTLSITFGQNAFLGRTALILLTVAWVLLVGAVGFCVISVWFIMRIGEAHIDFVNQGWIVIREMIRRKLPREWNEEEKKRFEALNQRPLRKLRNCNDRAWFFLQSGMGAFIISLAVFCAVGIVKTWWHLSG